MIAIDINMPNNQKIERMLFDYETTNKTDYHLGEIKEYPKNVFKRKPQESTRKEPEYKSVHTLSQWLGEVPPFSLLHKPKDIVKTNPNNVQQYVEPPIDIYRIEAQKTRPRLVMTPAVSMDDIEDEHARNLLCTDMYTSAMTQAMNEAETPPISEKAPLPGRPAPANPIRLPKLQPPYVSPEWRMESVGWDSKQLRGHCDATEIFWLTQRRSK